MSGQHMIDQAKIEGLVKKLHKEAEASGYHLNPEMEFTGELARGLLVNEERYGYWACPCRLASGIKESDLDIICPCDYRDADLLEYNACYCALYVSQKVINGEIKVHSIPERRPDEESRKRQRERKFPAVDEREGALPVWRCKVCGYLCARENPPEVCPICKAKKDRFERFM